MRVIVSDQAGTTRDAIDTPIEVDGRPLLLVDTAGIRRAAKVSESVEYYTSLRSQRAAERADVALVVCDASAGVTSQDLRIAELAMKAGCATALVLNKWDLTSGDEFDLDRERARVNRKLRLRPRVLTASAKTGRHVNRLHLGGGRRPGGRSLGVRSVLGPGWPGRGGGLSAGRLRLGLRRRGLLPGRRGGRCGLRRLRARRRCGCRGRCGLTRWCRRHGRGLRALWSGRRHPGAGL